MVVGLECIEANEVLELGDVKGLGDLPRLPVGDTDVADLALSDKGVEGAEGFLNRSHGVVGMDLVEIDVVRLEAPQAHFDGVHDVSTRRAHVIAARADTRVNLGRKHDVLTGDVQILERLTKWSSRSPLRSRRQLCRRVDASVGQP